MTRPRAYLDHAATAPLAPAAREAMLAWLGEGYGNPSSLHERGRRARLAVHAAREAVAGLIGARPDEIVFTSGATEADNLAVRGAAWAMREETGRTHVLVGAIEHPAVLQPALALRREGFEVEIVPAAGDGVVPLDEVAARLRPDTALLALMAVNNELGTVQPVREAAARARQVGALVHCDAVQAVGWSPVDVHTWGVDLLSLSSHKIGGPQGAGALFVRQGLALVPQLRGGEQENQRRAGTENVAALAGFGVAAGEAARAREVRAEALERVGRRLCQGVLAAVEGATRVGAPDALAPHVACFLFEDVDAETLLFALDMEGVAASSGAACSSRTLEPSPVLLALGVPRARALSAIRFSWGPQTTDDEVDLLLACLPVVVARNRACRRSGVRP